MSDFYKKMLQNSMDREAKRLASNGGVTEKDRYGNLLDSVKGRDLRQEEIDKHQNIISNIHKTQKKIVNSAKKNIEKIQGVWNAVLQRFKTDNEEKQMNFSRNMVTG